MGHAPITETSQPKRPPRRFRRVLARFRRNQSGASAIEFGFVLTPFLMLMFAVIEVAMLLWTSQILDESLNQASRSLLTGQSQTLYTGSNASRASAFRDAICAKSPALVDCGKLSVDVRSYASFAAAQAGSSGSDPVSGGKLDTSGFSYTQPKPGEIVVVRAVLEYKLFFTTWSSALANIGDGKHALMASTTFRTEPFTAAGS